MSTAPTDDDLARALADALIDRLATDPTNAHLRHRLLVAAGLLGDSAPSPPPPPPLSQEQAADRLGLTRAQLRRLESRALLKLRHRLPEP